MRGQQVVWGAWAIAVVCGLGACFKPALEREVDDAEDTAETAPDTVLDTLDGADTTDTKDPDTVPDTDASDTEDTADSGDTAEPDVAPTCSLDGECVGLARPPCVVGRCVAQRCAAVNVTVPCDDGDVCTAADQCQAGVCVGRAFTAEESKSWLRVIGGSGVQQVTGIATHPSGHVTIVGAFDEEVTVDGQPALVTEGGFDGFVVRLSSTGALVSANRFGAAETDDAPIFLAPDAENIGIVWSTLPRDATEPRRHFYAEASSTTVPAFGHREIPGEPIAMDTFPGGHLLIATRVRGAVEIPMVDGGTTTFSDSEDSSTYLARFSSDGAVWTKLGTALRLGSLDESRTNQYVVVAGGRVHWSVTSLAGGRVGGVALARSEAEGFVRHHLVLDEENGALLTQEVVDFGPQGGDYTIYFASRFLRQTLVETRGPIDSPSGEISVTGHKRLLRPCSAMVQDRLTRFGAAENDELLALIATEQQTVDLGGGIVIPGGPHALAIARYDAACRPQLATAFVLPPIWDSPARLRQLGVVSFSKAVEAGTRGRAYVVTPIRGLIEPGGVFGPGELTVEGFNDTAVGSVGPTDLHSCVPGPR